MYSRMLWRVASLVAVVVALGGQGLAQPAAPTELRGIIHDYVFTNGERWHVSGEWSVQLRGQSKGDFSAALIGVPRDNPPAFPGVSVAHTHHVSIVEGDVAITVNASGHSILTISGAGTFTGNGNLQSTFSWSPVQVTIKGGNAISYSNFDMIIGGLAATNHYGTEPFDGLVTHVGPPPPDQLPSGPCPAGQPSSLRPSGSFVPTQDCQGWVTPDHPLARR